LCFEVGFSSTVAFVSVVCSRHKNMVYIYSLQHGHKHLLLCKL
jgi:hypothetical protein